MTKNERTALTPEQVILIVMLVVITMIALVALSGI